MTSRSATSAGPCSRVRAAAVGALVVSVPITHGWLVVVVVVAPIRAVAVAGVLSAVIHATASSSMGVPP